MSDSESDGFQASDVDSGSDGFQGSPQPIKKVPAAKKTAAGPSKAAKAPAKKAPAAKKQPLAAKKHAPNDSISGSENTDYADTPAKPKAKPRAAELGDEENAGPSKPAGAKTASEMYQKLSQLEHVLKRPDTYIGSVEAITQQMWVFDSENKAMVNKNITYVPGFFKIFDEILVNAADNKTNDPTMSTIKVTIDREKNQISVQNDGKGIPVEMHKKEKIMIPELIFGNLLTSSNYDDDQKKLTGGRNGYGAKLANIYSLEFIVETADKVNGKKYRQVFSNNMGTKGTPKITENKKGEEWTKITFTPDLKRFGMSCIDDDTYSLLSKRVYDMAGTVKDIKVTLNDERIKIKGFKQYVEMYLNSMASTNEDAPASKPVMVYEAVHDRWEVAFALSDGEQRHVSFVNSISTSKGGTHVEMISTQLANKLLEQIKKKNKGVTVKPFQVKNYMWIFVNCLIENPAFDSQTKETLTLKSSAFGSKCDLKEDFIKKVGKSGIIEQVLSFAKFKQDQAMKKTDGSKRTRITGITKLEDANSAGGRNAKQCTLIITEGDSAKALAVSGLSVVGRDHYGVFPIRGKLLNVREASHDQIMKNTEIQNIRQILGLKHGATYASTDTLRYGHLMIMTDQDHDGSHIKGLLINFLDHFYPSLLRLPNFLVEFITPIVRVWKGKQELTFYTMPQYEEWKEQNNEGRGWESKYYKGLGTSTSADAKKYFNDLDRHRLAFDTMKPEDRELIDMAFNKKKADDRKEWLRQYRPGTFLNHDIATIPIADFVNKELILFSMADNVRSIPSMADGLKPGQRKVLFGCFKRNLQKEIKVAQLVGYVSEKTAYHHGEASLTSTIVGLAQNFVGSNNINLLSPNGQFGTRLAGGKDAASARYIFTAIPRMTRAIFHPNDDGLLNYLVEDGSTIEPEYFMPILPLVLVNGADGIGTGWSTSIPNYNPVDIVDNLRRMMQGEEPERMNPWFRGFNGSIERMEQDKYKISGILDKVDDTSLEITELPIRKWTQDYKEMLEEFVTGGEKDKVQQSVKDYEEHHTDTTVHFKVHMTDAQMRAAEQEGLDKKFKLTTTMSTGNMVCFDLNGKIKKYASAEDILVDFFHKRLEFYGLRKQFLADELNKQFERLSNQARFVQMIITKELSVSNKKRAVIVAELRSLKFKPFPKGKKKDEGEAESVLEEEDEGQASDYDYLLGMAIWSLTSEKVEKLLSERNVKESELVELLKLSPKDLWNTDLDNFLAEWESLLEEDIQAAKTGKPKTKGAIKAATKRKKRAAGEDSDESDDFVVKPAKAKPKPKAKASPVKISPVKRSGDGSASDDEKPPAKKAASKPKPAAVAKSTILDDSDDDDDMYLTKPPAKDPKQSTLDAFAKPKPTAAASSSALKPKAKPPTVKKPAPADSDSDVVPIKKAKPAPAPKKTVVDPESDSDAPTLPKAKAALKPKAKLAVMAPARKPLLSESEDSDVIAKPKAKKGSGKKAKSDSDESEEDYVPPARTVASRAGRGQPARYVDLDDDDDDDDFA